jgi:hypothetical protein
MIYTLKQGNKTVSVQHKKRWYVIGFPKVVHARAIHYNIAPEGKITLLKKDHIYASLFIPKHSGDHWDPMNDGNFHVQSMNKNDFYKLVCRNLGIIYAYNLKHEDAHEFTFDTFVFEPTSSSSK